MIRSAAAGLLFVSCLLPGSANAAGGANDYLLTLAPAVQATMLAKVINADCVGKTAFYMGLGIQPGTSKQGFWSVRCGSGDTYVVEVNPNGTFEVLRCSAFEINDAGKCFKKFSPT